MPYHANKGSFKKGRPGNIGEKNPMWKGDNAGYFAIHLWIRKKFGTPRKCSECGTTKAKAYHWANISGKCKRDINDFKRLCVKCHRKFDNTTSKGESHVYAKLTNEQVIEIRNKYIPDIYTQKKLAKEYHVCRQVIGDIINRKTWKHI